MPSFLFKTDILSISHTFEDRISCSDGVVTDDKNDGLIRPKEARWKTSDPWTPTSWDAMHAQNNWYYPDEGINEPGYNHNEMRDYYRKYSPNKGGISAPWQDINVWLNGILE